MIEEKQSRVDKRDDDFFVNQKISNERKDLELNSCYLKGEIDIFSPGKVRLNNCAFEAFSEVVINGRDIELSDIVIVVTDKHDNVYKSIDEDEYILIHLNGETAKVFNTGGKILVETSNVDEVELDQNENVQVIDALKVR